MGLQWRDQLSVGNDLIDTDHKHLIEVINNAEECLRNGNRKELAVTLDELARYSNTHFEREELIARAVGYPTVEQLHDSHTKLVETLNTFRSEVTEAWTDASFNRFGTYLRNWLIQHVIKEDLPMKPWLTKHSPRFDPRC